MQRRCRRTRTSVSSSRPRLFCGVTSLSLTPIPYNRSRIEADTFSTSREMACRQCFFRPAPFCPPTLPPPAICSLSGNSIGPEGAVAIARALERNCGLTDLACVALRQDVSHAGHHRLHLLIFVVLVPWLSLVSLLSSHPALCPRAPAVAARRTRNVCPIMGLILASPTLTGVQPVLERDWPRRCGCLCRGPQKQQ